MGRDDKHAAPGAPDEEDFDEGESHAADEPTAVWDENALRAAGLGDMFKRREPEVAAPPAAPPAKKAATGDPSIVIEPDVVAEQLAEQPPAPSSAAATPVPPAPVAAPPASGGLSWIATLAIAIVLGAVAYGLIRLLRG